MAAITITMDDEAIDALATAIASKININGNGGGAAAEAEEAEADDFAEEEKPREITLTALQDSIKEAVGKHGKEKIKALVKKVASADKVVDIPKEKYQAVLDALKKVK